MIRLNRPATALMLALAAATPALAAPLAPVASVQTHHLGVTVDGVEVAYREAGPRDAPAILLLHGFPTSSHMFRDLIPILAQGYRVVAPDLPGFGQTVVPAGYPHSFAALTDTVDGFATAIGLDRFAIYVFDYGAPVGLRLALKHPERITAIISQNGNAYAEGLSPAWSPIQAYWQAPTPENRAALAGFLKLETTRWQYTEGVRDPSLVAPEAYLMDQLNLDRPGNAEFQLDLFRDYQSNVALYPTFQAYFRQHQPPLLAVWGQNDPFFLPAGAEAYRRDLPGAEVKLYDTGHFALETHVNQIGADILAFLARSVR